MVAQDPVRKNIERSATGKISANRSANSTRCTDRGPGNMPPVRRISAAACSTTGSYPAPSGAAPLQEVKSTYCLPLMSHACAPEARVNTTGKRLLRSHFSDAVTRNARRNADPCASVTATVVVGLAMVMSPLRLIIMPLGELRDYSSSDP